MERVGIVGDIATGGVRVDERRLKIEVGDQRPGRTADATDLWLAGGVCEVLPVDDRGVVRADVAAGLQWFSAELAAGDAVVIDGLAPHYSQANGSDAPRRVFIASYAPANEGYDRAHYYGARSDRMREATEHDGRFRISTLADFEGTEVAPESASEVCTHS